MLRPTLATFRQSRGPNTNGLCIGDTPGISALVNEAQERLIKDPQAPEEGWWGTWAKMVFNVSPANPYITAPRSVARLILMSVCQTPTRIQNGFFEYLDFGIGPQPLPCKAQGCQQLQAYDRELVPFWTDFVSGQLLRIYPALASDAGKSIVVSGTDTSGNTIYTSHNGARVNGQFVTLAAPFVDCGPFGSVTGLQKDITLDALHFYGVTAATGAEVLLLTMEPTERTAAYRRYLVNGLPAKCCTTPTGLVQVSAQCKLDLIPVSADTDFLLIQNIPALIEECQSIRYSSMDSGNAQANSDRHHAKALALLYGELDHFLGRERPAITVPIFGSDRMVRQPV